MIPQISESQKIRFWDRVARGELDACWPWLASRNGDGYGTVGFGYTVYRTHVVAFFLNVGVWPSGRVVMHSCDNPPCCNPKHLVDGTQSQNIDDCISKGRGNRPGASVGEANHSALLVESDIRELRRLGLIFSPADLAKLPEAKGVHRRTIADILNGKTWSHVR